MGGEARRRLCLCLVMAAWAGCGSDAPAAPAAPAAAGEGETLGFLRLMSPGAEPRRRERFAFAPGREERGTLTVDSHFEPAGAAPVEEHLELDLAVATPDASHLVLTVTGARTTAPDIPAIAGTVGTTLRAVFEPTGTTDLPEITPAAGAHPVAAEYVRGALVQAASNLVPAFPEEPAGVGARWGGGGLVYELLERDDARVVVERRGGLDREEVLPDGRRIDVAEEQVYRMEAPRDGIVRRMEATLITRGSEGTRRTTRLRLEVHGGA